MVQTKSTRNSSIDLFRLICSIMVVMIHTSPFSEFGKNAGFFAVEVFPRIAVPYFFATSGYFYTKKLQEQSPLIPYICKLFLTYVLWSIPYYCISFFQWGYKNLIGFAKDCVYSFILTGSSYHFWFFPALLISIVITTLLWKLRCNRILISLSLAAYAIGCLGCSHYQLGIQLPIISVLYRASSFTLIRRIVLMGFPFFISGYVVRLINTYIMDSARNVRFIHAFCFSVFLWSVELWVVISKGLSDNIIISPMLYPLVVSTLLMLLNNTHTISPHVARKSRAAANFMYYSHPLCMMLLEQLPIQASPTQVFLITVILTSMGGIYLSDKSGKLLPYLIG